MGGLGVLKRAMGLAHRYTEKARQRSEVVARRGGENHSREIVCVEREVEFEESPGFQETQIKSHIVTEDRRIANDLGQIVQNLGDPGRAGKHIVGDAGKLRYEGGQGPAGIDEGRPFLFDPRASKADHADFNNGVPFRVQPCGFEIKRS